MTPYSDLVIISKDDAIKLQDIWSSHFYTFFNANINSNQLSYFLDVINLVSSACVYRENSCETN